MAGRPRKPRWQKEIAGTIRPDRENPHPPNFTPSTVECPMGLSAPARAIWETVAPELAEHGVLKKVQEHQLVMYCNAVATAQKAQKVLDRQGTTYKTKTQMGSTMVRKRPELEIVDKMMGHARQFAMQFGLTPASEGRISAAPKKQSDSPYAEFGKS